MPQTRRTFLSQNEFQDQFSAGLSPPEKSAVAAKRLQMIQAFCEIVTVNGRPFEYLTDSGFQKLIKADLYDLEKAFDSQRISQN